MCSFVLCYYTAAAHSQFSSSIQQKKRGILLVYSSYLCPELNQYSSYTCALLCRCTAARHVQNCSSIQQLCILHTIIAVRKSSNKCYYCRCLCIAAMPAQYCTSTKQFCMHSTVLCCVQKLCMHNIGPVCRGYACAVLSEQTAVVHAQ